LRRFSRDQTVNGAIKTIKMPSILAYEKMRDNVTAIHWMVIIIKEMERRVDAP
jgi:hypothetical protein